MTQLTILEASKATGKSVKTLYRHMREGRISYSTNSDNVKVIDLSELSRIYEVNKKPNENGENLIRENMPSHETDKISDLRTQLALSHENANSLKMILDEKDKRIELLTYQYQQVTVQTEQSGRKFTKWEIIIAIIVTMLLTALAVNLAWFYPDMKIKP
jgi:hypothetical protein